MPWPGRSQATTWKLRGQVLRGGRPQGGGRRAERGPEDQQREVGASTEADGGDGHAEAPCRTRAARARTPSHQDGGLPEVVVVGWVAGERGHGALLGADVVVGGRQGGGHPVGVHAQAGQQVGGLGAGDDGAAQQGGQRRPLGVPAAVGALVDLLGGRDVQGGGEAGCRECGAPDQRGEHRVGLVRHRRRPAAGALGELADLRPRQGQHVVGDPPPAVGAADGRVADPGDRRAPGVPGRQSLPRPSASTVAV